MVKTLWLVTIISSLIGALVAVVFIGTATSAPQQGAAAAIGVAWAAIPYCLARAAAELGAPTQRRSP